MENRQGVNNNKFTKDVFFLSGFLRVDGILFLVIVNNMYVIIKKIEIPNKMNLLLLYVLYTKKNINKIL